MIQVRQPEHSATVVWLDFVFAHDDGLPVPQPRELPQTVKGRKLLGLCRADVVSENACFQQSSATRLTLRYSFVSGGVALFEIAENSGLIRRIATGLLELVRASLRPLKYGTVRLRFLRDFVLFYVLLVLLLHFVGYRSWYPQFHWVRETLHDSAISAVPLSLLAAVLSYLSMLRERDWL